MSKRIYRAVIIGLASTIIVACGDDESTAKIEPTAAPAEQVGTADEGEAVNMESKVADTATEVMESVTTAAKDTEETVSSMVETATETADQAMDQATAKMAEAAEAVEAALEMAPAAVNGAEIYAGLCFSCHDTGLMEAPKLGDSAAWAPRLAQGTEMLYQSALNGKGMMPAKGGNPALSDEEVKAVVDYMVSKAQ